MNIILINQYCGPEKYSPTFRPTHLAKEWVKKGHDVTIIGSAFSHYLTSTPAFRGPMLTEVENGIRYVLLRGLKYKGNGVKRALSMVWFAAHLWKARKWIIKTIRPDVVLSGSVHGIDFLPALSMARRSKSLLVREVRDLWPLTLIQLGGIARLHPFVLLLGWVERLSYRKADLVTSTLFKSFDHMQAYGLSADRWVFIPQGVDVHNWDSCTEPLPALHEETLSQIAMNNHLIVGYTGAHGMANTLGVLVRAAELLRGDPVSFVFVGQGPEKEPLMAASRRMGLSNVYFLPPVPKRCMGTLLSLIDVAYIGWQNEPIYRYGISPNKLMDYMIAGKPVVHSVAASNDLVSESGCGLSVPAEDAAAVASAIKRMLEMGRVQRMQMGQNGREYVSKNFSYQRIAWSYWDVLMKHQQRINHDADLILLDRRSQAS